MIRKELFKKPKNQLEQGEDGTAPAAPTAPEEDCIVCPDCKAMVFDQDFRENRGVCARCGYHFQLGVRMRLLELLDPDSFQEEDAGLCATNVLDFPEYDEKLAQSQRRSGEKEGVITGAGEIAHNPCAIFAMEPQFMMASMGQVVGEKITRTFERAIAQRLPVVGIIASGGARMQEGLLSLMQMAKTSAAVKRHSDAGLLYIAVLTDPTTGGVTASFAMLGDIILAEPGALIAFAGPRVIEQTLRMPLPEGFQRAEFLLEKGFLDAIVDRRELRDVLASLLSLHREVA